MEGGVLKKVDGAIDAQNGFEPVELSSSKPILSLLDLLYLLHGEPKFVR